MPDYVFIYKDGKFHRKLWSDVFSIDLKENTFFENYLEEMGYFNYPAKTISDDLNFTCEIYESKKEVPYRFLATADFGHLIDEIYFEDLPDLLDFLQNKVKWVTYNGKCSCFNSEPDLY